MRLLLEPNAAKTRIGRLGVLDTPALITYTQRGFIPHISPGQNISLPWIHVPFESFLEQSPPIPSLLAGTSPKPLHTLLAIDPKSSILSMSLRDPTDMRPMPPNGNTHVAAMSLRGVRKVTVQDWADHMLASRPDVVVALTDTPVPATATTTAGSAGFSISQKRLTKSIERSASWVGHLIASVRSWTTTHSNTENETRQAPHILVHLAGLASHAARKAFAQSLLEPLSASDPLAKHLPGETKRLTNLDEGVAGYVVDLEPLRNALGFPSSSSSSSATTTTAATTQTTLHTQTKTLTSLLHTSFSLLPASKLRLFTGTRSPHEILLLVRDIGVDVVDAKWAVDAASVGVALDFRFPVVPKGSAGASSEMGKIELGHNLYDVRYRLDFGAFCDPLPTDGENPSCEDEICPCAACSPTAIVSLPNTKHCHTDDLSLIHNHNEDDNDNSRRRRPPYTRAYVHHLLHTHEMSAHALLVMHNLEVVRQFLRGVRRVCGDGGDGIVEGGSFEVEVERFFEKYCEEARVFEEARAMWSVVDLERGKGRLKREKEKEGEKEVGAEAVT